VKVDGYVRVSRVGGRSGPSFISPKVQREQIEGWARFKGAELLEVHVDLDESGGKVQRPGLQRALERVESGESDGIVVAKLDRFARSLTGALESIKRLDQAGATFVSVAEGLDPTTPAGKMMMRLMLVMAEFELDRMKEAWEESRRQAVGRGIHLAGRVPTGYLRRRGGRLEPDPVLADRIARCFLMRAERRNWREIVRYVEESARRDPSEEPVLDHRSLALMMRNRAYVGEARSGPFWNPCAHEALVDRGVFEIVQQMRSLTAQTSKRPTLLAGLMRCSGCRYSLTSHTEMRKTIADRSKYACVARSPHGVCGHPVSVFGSAVEDLIVETFFDLYEASPQARRASTRSRRRAEGILEDAERRLAGAEAEGSHEAGEWAVARDEVTVSRRKVVELARSTLLPPSAELRRRWPGLSVVERRRILGLQIDAVLLREDRGYGLADRLLVVPFGAAPEGLPQPGHRSTPLPYEWGSQVRPGVAIFGRDCPSFAALRPSPIVAPPETEWSEPLAA
jgi:site-specific DNA recombinase